MLFSTVAWHRLVAKTQQSRTALFTFVGACLAVPFVMAEVIQGATNSQGQEAALRKELQAQGTMDGRVRRWVLTWVMLAELRSGARPERAAGKSAGPACMRCDGAARMPALAHARTLTRLPQQTWVPALQIYTREQRQRLQSFFDEIKSPEKSEAAYKAALEYVCALARGLPPGLDVHGIGLLPAWA